MKLKLSFWQRLALRGIVLDGSVERWLRERALNLPQSKRDELRARLHVSEGEIEALQAALQEEVVRELVLLVG